MLISLFPTPFDQIHFHGSAGLVPKLILTPCLKRSHIWKAEREKLLGRKSVNQTLAIIRHLNTFSQSLQYTFSPLPSYQQAHCPSKSLMASPITILATDNAHNQRNLFIAQEKELSGKFSSNKLNSFRPFDRSWMLWWSAIIIIIITSVASCLWRGPPLV